MNPTHRHQKIKKRKDEESNLRARQEKYWADLLRNRLPTPGNRKTKRREDRFDRRIFKRRGWV